MLGAGEDAGSEDAGILPGPDAGSLPDGLEAGGPVDAPVADGPAIDGITIGPTFSGNCATAPARGTCPIDRPIVGSACPVAGTTCEYGGGHDVWCRDRWTCAEDRTWQPGRRECADRCTAEIPVAGSACDGAVADVPCSYASQALCVCFGNSDSKQWYCATAGTDPTCPDQLPLYGSPCDDRRNSCRYGPGCGGYNAICCGGSWITFLVACSE